MADKQHKPARRFSPGDFVYIEFSQHEDPRIREKSRLPGIVVKNQFSPGGLQNRLHVACSHLNEYAAQGNVQDLYVSDDPREIVHIVPKEWVVDRDYPAECEVEHS